MRAPFYEDEIEIEFHFQNSFRPPRPSVTFITDPRDVRPLPSFIPKSGPLRGSEKLQSAASFPRFGRP